MVNKQRTPFALWSLFLACNAMVAFKAHAQSPIAYYPMNGDSLTLQVVSTYALEGTIHGSPESCEDRFGNPNGALNFEPGDYVTIPGSSSLNPLPFSVSVWYKPDLTANQGTVPLFKKYYPALWNGMMMYTKANGGRNFLSGWYIRNSANRVISEYGSPVFAYQDEEASDDMWRHAVFTVDSVEGRLYFDGQLQDVQPWDGQAMASTNNLNWQFAGTYNWADTLGYEGAMDDLTVWNHALTEGEVWELYSEGGFDQNGCTDPEACNYDYTALVDNGLCLYPVLGGDCLEGQTFCADGTWWNPNDQMCHPFPCLSCPGDFDDDHLVSVSDLLDFMAVYNQTCEPAGCLDELACNFNPLVLVDDGSCIYGSVDSCGCLSDCQGNLIGDLDGDGICDNAPSTGCGDSLACNYSADLCLTDSALCIYGDWEPGSPCDDGDPNTFNDVADSLGCNCAGTSAVAEDGSGPCEGQTSVTYHGWTYELVELGDQCWFRENLATEQFSNGDAIVFGTQTNWTTYSPRMAYHYDDSAYRHVFGGLYNWGAVNDSRGLCPVGWHEPNRTEFNALVDWMVAEGYNANDMKLPLDSATAPAYWEFGSPTNESGFSAMPAGERDPYTGEDLEVNRRAHFWTSSQSQTYSYSGEKFNLNLGSEYGFNTVLKFRGASVRCLLGEFAEGCTDPNFVEYDLGAEEDDGSCVTPN